MNNIIAQLANDEAGFIVSAELVLVSSIVVIGMIVGLSEVAFNVNQELEDVGSAIGSVNQGFEFNGSSGTKGKSVGSTFHDCWDDGDGEWDVNCDTGPQAEQ